MTHNSIIIYICKAYKKVSENEVLIVFLCKCRKGDGMKKNDIIIIHGTDYKDMTMQILQEAHLEELIQDKESAVALKPNLVTAVPPSGGATTHACLLYTSRCV